MYKYKILLNAQPFWFWPTAAIASFFPFLKNKFQKISFIWSGHSLDLQYKLPYDIIYNLDEIWDEKLKEIVSWYDIFFSAMDFIFAEKVKKLWIITIFYDALTWFWEPIPESFKCFDFYFCQNFFGVEERINNNLDKFPYFKIIPPINSNNFLEIKEKKYFLVNFWGLQNPFWKDDDVIYFVEKFVKNLFNIVSSWENLLFTASHFVAKRLNKYWVQTFLREEMKEILSQTKISFMTPWLWNIYDVANYNIPTVWLPPSNISQWQQFDILINNWLCDAYIWWENIIIDSIDSKQAEKSFIDQINFFIKNSSDLVLQDLFKKNIDNISSFKSTKTRWLLDTFWTNWENELIKIFFEFVDWLGK